MIVSRTHLVQCFLDLLELLWCGVARVNASDFTTKVCKLGWVSRGREREGYELDSHSVVLDGDGRGKRAK